MAELPQSFNAILYGTGSGTYPSGIAGISYQPAGAITANFSTNYNLTNFKKYFTDLSFVTNSMQMTLLKGGVQNISLQEIQDDVYNSRGLATAIDSLFVATSNIFSAATGFSQISATSAAKSFLAAYEKYAYESDSITYFLSQGQSIPFMDAANISFTNALYRPTGVLFGFDTVPAVYDIKVKGGEDFAASTGNDVVIFGSDIARDVDTGGGNDVVIFSNGNNRVADSGGSDLYVFAGTQDTVIFREAIADRKIVKDANGEISLTSSRTGETDRVVGADRLVFNDGTLALDASGNAGQAYRLYQAAFDRTPDKEGLSFWIKQLDGGKANLGSVADNFINSTEFQRLYGTSSTVSNTKYVDLLYTHTLGRGYDQGGLNFWVNKLDTGQTSRGDLLAFFSESSENQARVADVLDKGVWIV